MSGVQTAIGLQDRITGPVNNIISALNMVASSFENVHGASENCFGSMDVSGIRSQLTAASTSMAQIATETDTAKKNMDQYNTSVSSGTALMNTLKGAVGGLSAVYALKQMVGLSDEVSNTTARLNLMNDGLQSTDQLEKMIMASANSARSSYLDTAAAVAKFGNNAGDAFDSTQQIVQFSELINKQFKIAGASGTEASNAMLQLTQALGSGVLRGDELNSIFEQAPNLIQSIADYMGVSIGQIRTMAADGKITADIVKNAMFASADEINKKFNEMPMTWGDVWTLTVNKFLDVVQPLLTAISWMANNWSVIEPLVLGAAAALAIYVGAIEAHNIAVAVSNGLEALAAARAAISAGASVAEAAAMQTATGAQIGLNAAMWACPITWIIAAIVLAIAVIFAVVAAVNKVRGTTVSAAGVIMGCVAVAGAFLYNTGIGVLNAIIQAVWAIFVAPFLGIVEWVLNVANGGFNTFGDAVRGLIGQIIGWFLGLGKIVTVIIDAIAGTDWTAKLSDLQASVTTKFTTSKAITLDKNAPTVGNTMSYSSAYSKGYSVGQTVSDKFTGAFKGSTDAANLTAGNTANTAANTAAIKDNLDITNENLKYLRDFAEERAINRYTTTEIKVDMTNNNTIGSDQDIDGIVTKLKTRIEEELDAGAEGVH